MAYRFAVLALVLFTLFMAWIVYLADIGRHFYFFDLAHSFSYGDKVGHFFLFGFFSLLANIVLKMRGSTVGPIFVPYGSLLIFCAAATEEMTQYFVSTRSCDLTDLAADLIGIVAFSFLLYGPLARYFCPSPGK